MAQPYQPFGSSGARPTPQRQTLSQMLAGAGFSKSQPGGVNWAGVHSGLLNNGVPGGLHGLAGAGLSMFSPQPQTMAQSPYGSESVGAPMRGGPAPAGAPMRGGATAETTQVPKAAPAAAPAPAPTPSGDLTLDEIRPLLSSSPGQTLRNLQAAKNKKTASGIKVPDNPYNPAAIQHILDLFRQQIIGDQEGLAAQDETAAQMYAGGDPYLLAGARLRGTQGRGRDLARLLANARLGLEQKVPETALQLGTLGYQGELQKFLAQLQNQAALDAARAARPDPILQLLGSL